MGIVEARLGQVGALGDSSALPRLQMAHAGCRSPADPGMWVLLSCCPTALWLLPVPARSAPRERTSHLRAPSGEQPSSSRAQEPFPTKSNRCTPMPSCVPRCGSQSAPTAGAAQGLPPSGVACEGQPSRLPPSLLLPGSAFKFGPHEEL